MVDSNILDKPVFLDAIASEADKIGFSMSSDLYIGALLKTLVTSKPKSKILELGTGGGLSLSWMVDGMDSESKIITIENDPKLVAIAKKYFSADSRVEIVLADGADWLRNYTGNKFDLIFADAWPGKYSEIEEVLQLVKIGGFYIIDDMNPRPSWPEEHGQKASHLIQYLEQRDDFNLTKMNWSSGIIIATKKY